MGYGGGTFSGTLTVDLVATDVSAIVSGICGNYGNTLTDVVGALSGLSNNLFDYSYYRSAADVLVSIEQILYGIKWQTDRLSFDEYGRLIITS